MKNDFKVSKQGKKIMTDIAYDMVEMGLSAKETYERVKDYYALKSIDFRTIFGKAFYNELCKLAERIENGEEL